jgi:hypothetical protein
MADKHRGINDRGRAADDSVRELDFDDDDRVPPRSGDPLTDDERELLSRKRERTAGLSGGEVADHGNSITDDDLSPETLLDEEEDYEVYTELVPADQELSVVDAAEIGGGSGKDEAELAREENPDR